MVIETADAVLIASQKKSQEVKNIVELLKEKDFDEATVHKKVYRPWGNYNSIESDSGWQIKNIEVKVGESIRYRNTTIDLNIGLLLKVLQW